MVMEVGDAKGVAREIRPLLFVEIVLGCNVSRLLLHENPLMPNQTL